MSELLAAGIPALFSAAGAVLVALIGAKQSRAEKQRRKREEQDKREREERQRTLDALETARMERELLSYELADANAKATIACSVAVLDGMHNGELKAASKALTASQKRLDRFVKQQGLKQTKLVK